MYPSALCSTVYNSQDTEAIGCPSTDAWTKKLWYIYTMVYHSAIKRNTLEPVLVRWMNLEPVIQSEVRRKKQILYINAYEYEI